MVNIAGGEQLGWGRISLGTGGPRLGVAVIDLEKETVERNSTNVPDAVLLENYNMADAQSRLLQK